MQNPLKTLFLVALGLLLSACKSNQELSERKKQELTERGSSITQAVTAALMGKLLPQVQQNGPANAVRFCSVQAIPTADSLAKQEHVTISRISHQNRSPRNIANNQELELINSYISQLKAGKPLTPTLVTQSKRTTFYSPIVIQMPTCLKCHGKPGTDISPEVQSVISELYPQDKAVGFESGQLRGLFKVEFHN